MNQISNEQKGWLEITYLSNRLRICRGDKGTLFILRKLDTPNLFMKFKEFIKSCQRCKLFLYPNRL